MRQSREMNSGDKKHLLEIPSDKLQVKIAMQWKILMVDLYNVNVKRYLVEEF